MKVLALVLLLLVPSISRGAEPVPVVEVTAPVIPPKVYVTILNTGDPAPHYGALTTMTNIRKLMDAYAAINGVRFELETEQNMRAADKVEAASKLKSKEDQFVASEEKAALIEVARQECEIRAKTPVVIEKQLDFFETPAFLIPTSFVLGTVLGVILAKNL